MRRRGAAFALVVVACASRERVLRPAERSVAVDAGEAPPRGERVALAGGLARLGAAAGEDHFEERPARAARVRGFSIDRLEVRRAGYAACVEAGRCGPARCESAASDPVRCVTWTDATAYCAWRGGRLPTEAEWQRAAGGAIDADRRYPWGNEAPTAGSTPRDETPEGVRDLGGSLAEWTSDGGDFYPAESVFDAGSPGDPDAGWTAPMDERPRADGGLLIVDDPRGPSASRWRVVRGGDDGIAVEQRTVSLRRFRQPGDALRWIGLRCVYES